MLGHLFSGKVGTEKWSFLPIFGYLKRRFLHAIFKDFFNEKNKKIIKFCIKTPKFTQTVVKKQKKLTHDDLLS